MENTSTAAYTKPSSGPFSGTVLRFDAASVISLPWGGLRGILKSQVYCHQRSSTICSSPLFFSCRSFPEVSYDTCARRCRNTKTKKPGTKPSQPGGFFHCSRTPPESKRKPPTTCGLDTGRGGGGGGGASPAVLCLLRNPQILGAWTRGDLCILPPVRVVWVESHQRAPVASDAHSRQCSMKRKAES